MKKTIKTTIALFLLFLASCSKEESISREGYYPLKMKDSTAWVEIADSGEKRSQGLMYRHSLPKDSGMLFIYPKSKKQSFWMKNTLIPLSIAFIHKDGEISEILEMMPADGRPDFMLPRYESHEKVMYSLEMPRGWFAKHGIESGAKVCFPVLVKYLFKWKDFKDFRGFAGKLRGGQRPIDLYIQKRLSPKAKNRLESAESNDLSETGQVLLVDDINFMLCKESIWKESFVSKEWQKFENPQGLSQLEHRLYRNRILLQQAYPDEIQHLE